jgi:hypothetical protein
VLKNEPVACIDNLEIHNVLIIVQLQGRSPVDVGLV